MKDALPYAFDTTRVVRLILRGVLGFEIVMIAGIVYALAAGRGLMVIAFLIVCGSFMLAFGWIVMRFLDATSGTITHESVIVEPMNFCGIRLPGPQGTLPIGSFQGIRVERVSGRIDTANPTGPSTRVYLIGRNGTSDLLIARASVEEGSALGQDLGAALRLPRIDSSSPY